MGWSDADGILFISGTHNSSVHYHAVTYALRSRNSTSSNKVCLTLSARRHLIWSNRIQMFSSSLSSVAEHRALSIYESYYLNDLGMSMHITLGRTTCNDRLFMLIRKDALRVRILIRRMLFMPALQTSCESDLDCYHNRIKRPNVGVWKDRTMGRML